jgi:hypothetical protein
VSVDRLAARLDKVTERLATGALNLERPGADLIAYYLSPNRLPADNRWSRKHAHTRGRLCERFAAPVIDAVICQDITTGHMQQIVNAPPTPGEGRRVQGMISALVSAGIEGGYLVNPRLARCTGRPGTVRCPSRRSPWPGNRRCGLTPPRSPPTPTWPRSAVRWLRGGTGPRRADGRHSCLQRAAVGRADRPDRPQVDPAARVIAVDRKVVEVAGHLYVEAPKNRKRRRTIYPRTTPAGYP